MLIHVKNEPIFEIAFDIKSFLTCEILMIKITVKTVILCNINTITILLL